MDYRSSIADDEHAAGASPWGSSPPVSPRRNGSSLPYEADTSNGFGQQDTETGAFQRPVTAESAAAAPDYNPFQQSGASQQPSRGNGGEQPAEAPQQPHAPVKPHGQSQQQHGRKSTGPQYKLQAKITGLERTGRKDPILRFDVHLAEHLISANPEAIVPAVPPALTSAGAGTDEDETRVKALMQRWFNYVCTNEVLMRDEEMILFVESDFGYSPMVKRKQPATGVRRKLLKQFAPPPDDTPELSDARPIVKLFYLGSMDAGHKVDKLVKSRRGLGLSESDFGVKLGGMHVQEPHQGLANAYRKLGRVIQTVGDCHAAQATAEATTVGDPFQYHSQDAFIVKETLTNRQLLIREFLQAQDNTRSKLNAADRLKASSSVRPEKVDEAIAALDEARNTELELMHRTGRVTQNLVAEKRRWFARTAADLRMSIRELVLREIEAERRTLALLESVRPDVRAIDASGGLSRLGRESHPAVRRSSLAASQGPKGDAWSGVPRRSDGLARSVSGSVTTIVPSIVAADEGDGEDGQGSGSKRLSASTLGLPGVAEEDDEDRVDARNAASRLATSTF
ncbi:hypothetical protein DL764_000744 [Monosporascus ibericus]|uniref:Vacuolar protein sorting-associated protein 17 n=1 Tax=Monosporascus ibericus TaxID=155417 RepID=A0A4Q4TTV7_9PEZI|nr:hypothetical protein DL764_000744 [Monosporascus ibericus]